MKINNKVLLVSAFLFSIISHTALAGWQVSNASNSGTTPREPFFQRGRSHQTVDYKGSAPRKSYSAYLPNSYHATTTRIPPRNVILPAVYAVSISGSLKENLERIMGRYNWKVVWKAPFDYNFDGRVTGSSLPNVVEKLLKPFPLQAVMYMSNRTLAIVPRTTT